MFAVFIQLKNWQEWLEHDVDWLTVSDGLT